VPLPLFPLELGRSLWLDWTVTFHWNACCSLLLLLLLLLPLLLLSDATGWEGPCIRELQAVVGGRLAHANPNGEQPDREGKAREGQGKSDKVEGCEMANERNGRLIDPLSIFDKL
jgi:hypothetical protein